MSFTYVFVYVWKTLNSGGEKKERKAWIQFGCTTVSFNFKLSGWGSRRSYFWSRHALLAALVCFVSWRVQGGSAVRLILSDLSWWTENTDRKWKDAPSRWPCARRTLAVRDPQRPNVCYARSNILLCDTVLVLRASNNNNVWKRLLRSVQPLDCVKLLTTSSFSHDHRRWRELRSDSEGLCRRKHRGKLPLIRAQPLRLIIEKRRHLICHFILFILYLVLGKDSNQWWKWALLNTQFLTPQVVDCRQDTMQPRKTRWTGGLQSPLT